MAKKRFPKKHGDIEKIILDFERGIDFLRKKLFPSSSDGTEKEDIRDVVVMEVCSIFKVKKLDIIDTPYLTGYDKHGALTLICYILNKKTHEKNRHSLVELSKYFHYDHSTLSKKITAFKSINSNTRIEHEKELLERYEKIIVILKAKKIIKT